MAHPDLPLIQEYLDQMLPPSLESQIGHHLAECEACRLQLGQLQQVFHALQGVQELPLTVDLSSRVLASLEGGPILARLRPALIAQTVIALLLLLWLRPAAEQNWAIGEWLRPGWAVLVELWANFSQQLSQLPLLLPGAQWVTVGGLALLAWAVGNGLLLPTQKLPSGE